MRGPRHSPFPKRNRVPVAGARAAGIAGLLALTIAATSCSKPEPVEPAGHPLTIDPSALVPTTPPPQPPAPDLADGEAIAVKDIYYFSDELGHRVPPRLRHGLEVREVFVGRSGEPATGLIEKRISSPDQFVSRPLELPDAPYLSVSFAVRRPEKAAPGAPVRFRIKAEHARGSATLLDETRDPEELGAGSTWADRVIDLGNMAGETVRFEFTIEQGPDPGPTQVIWSSPVVFNQPAAPDPTRPNVLLISLDTLRADRLGAYGYDRETSRAIDAFAESSVLFENCISPSSWTLPAHASIFTGLHPSVHGATTYDGATLPMEIPTLGELARARGYRAAAFSGGWVSSKFGFARGYERYAEHLILERKLENALDWLDGLKGRPFFLFFHTFEIHAPYEPPEEFAEKFTDPSYDGLLKGRFAPDGEEYLAILSEADRQRVSDLYDAGIAYTDAKLGDFFEALKARGLWENTLVAVFSDHGEELWDHGGWGHGVTLYEEELHVPLIIKLPGKEPAAGRVDALVSLMDLYPTVAEVLGSSPSVKQQGRNLMRLLRGTEASWDRGFTVSEVGLRDNAWEYIHENPRRYAARTVDAKLILNGEASENEFFRLGNDPGERTNLYPSAPEATGKLEQRLSEALRRYTDERQAFKDQGAVTMDEETAARLKALGYL